jgi:hypothetical protein
MSELMSVTVSRLKISIIVEYSEILCHFLSAKSGLLEGDKMTRLRTHKGFPN